MSLHESFWVTAGAAAPVIALAGVVAMADAMRVIDRFASPTDPVLRKLWPQTLALTGWLLGMAQMLLNGLVIFSQALVLWWALHSLVLGFDVSSPAGLTPVEPYAIIALVIAAGLGVASRGVHRSIEKQLKRKSQAQSSASGGGARLNFPETLPRAGRSAPDEPD